MAEKEKELHGLVDNASIAKICPPSNLRHLEHPHPMASLRIPGIGPSSFDRDYNPKVDAVLWLDTYARIHSNRNPAPPQQSGDNSSGKNHIFFDWAHLVGGTMIEYGAMCEYSFTKELYDLDIPKGEVDYTISQGFMGNCDVTVVTQGSAPDKDGTSRTLWTGKMRFVFVDQATRQPATLPAWFRDRHKGRGCLKQAFTMRPFRRPKETFVHKFMVKWTDVDSFGHANYASYITWVLEAIHAAVQSQLKQKKAGGADQKALIDIPLATLARGLAKYQASHFQECLEGDQVEVHVWQQAGGGAVAEEEELVWASLMKEDNEICQLKVWFFGNDA